MERNSFLVSRAFHHYLKASLLYSACLQLTVMIDAMVAGHFIGPNALTAINLALPLTTFITALSSLIGLGPAIMAAKAIGSRQTEKVNSIFSSAMYQAIIIGAIQMIVLYLFLPQVGKQLCTNEDLLPYLMDYLRILPITFFLMMIVYTLVSLIEADGHPNFATKAVALGCLLNVLLDVVLVKYIHLGIQGLALAMLANYLFVSIFFLLRMKGEGISYRWTLPKKRIINVTLAGLKEGTPIMLNDLMHSLMLFGVNSMLLAYYGENELYFWAIFLQILLFVMMTVDTAEGAILSIGSVLKGEDDSYGMHALIKRSWLLVGGFVLLVMIVVALCPLQVAMIFVESGEIPESWPQTLRILSLMLIPYALTTFMRSVFQVLGDKLCGLFFSLGHFLLIMVGLFISAQWNQQLLWWVFPIASWTLFALQLLYLHILRRRRHIPHFSIIPPSRKKNFLDLSVAYDSSAVTEAVQQICSFMQMHRIDPFLEMKVNICCEELMMNIVAFQTHKTRSYMDLSLALEDERIFFVLKDSGRPFNPLMVNCSPDMLKSEKLQLGLYLINNVCSQLSHKYMYGLNVVFANFDKEQKD